jgi:predicted phosphodiesterase
MIYITGDTHSDFSRFTEENFPIQSEMTKYDYIIICGDFGGVWTFEEESKREKEALDWLNNKNFTTLFVDGNHENYTRLYNYPIEEWKGGKVHEIRDSVLHLMRGEIFDIDNKKIFAFGGARSHDIQDGILNLDEEERIYEYRKRGAYFRIRDFSWWDLELPIEEEIQNGISNLEKVNYKVDYVISHCCPTSIQALINSTYKRDILTDYLQQISEKCTFKRWYFGHYHDYKQVNSQFTLLYEDIVPLEYESIFE